MVSRTLLWAVNAVWNSSYGGWNVNANSVENLNRWNAGNRVFSRNSLLSGHMRRRFYVPGFVCFAASPFLQPPTIFPSSSTSLPSVAN